MQPYPIFTVQASGPNETGVTAEVRCQLDAGGGLPEARTADDVMQVVATALAGAGATTVSISKAELVTADVPVAAPAEA
ncbi:hypothetical protein [Streptomyces sp. NBC_01373]|uniref:hypothetical protein n=1 Tax=Streptomyces sp. NBC_01373 TaxID=2903843 RepID=UPI00224E6372|nr:hypothetical protein [Streptomyces sp. NBC_01373]MCX4703855.1 hypothetical protein [Streptomyces sp. NBC_01373]